MGKILRTFGKGKRFTYTGCVAVGTTIRYGTSESEIRVSREDYAALLSHFGGSTVKLGTSRTRPPSGSVGAWLQENLSPTAIASYVGPILVAEGYAELVSRRPIEIRVR